MCDLHDHVCVLHIYHVKEMAAFRRQVPLKSAVMFSFVFNRTDSVFIGLVGLLAVCHSK